MSAETSEQVPRRLTSREEAVLVALVTRGASTDPDVLVTADDRARWLEQVVDIRTGRRCGCGTCPSIELTAPSDARPEEVSKRIVLEAGTTGALVMLFIDDDHLSYLELAPLDDEMTFPQFPDLEDLYFDM